MVCAHHTVPLADQIVTRSVREHAPLPRLSAV
jgi:hypothetical protein